MWLIYIKNSRLEQKLMLRECCQSTSCTNRSTRPRPTLLAGNYATGSTNCTTRLTTFGLHFWLLIMQLGRPQWCCCDAALRVPNRLLHGRQRSGEWNAGSVQDGDKQSASNTGQISLRLQPARLQSRADGRLPHPQRAGREQTCLHQVTTDASTGWSQPEKTGVVWEFEIDQGKVSKNVMYYHVWCDGQCTD